ncbi:MmoB/DmpM family protein [Dactylosporangium sp. CA-092794]|uniref:MmoB/DmpM family protein n=1 Tax=Dactylosporangium sp. CA-092794 TaxID=3239929 RepID=UPI003D8AF681
MSASTVRPVGVDLQESSEDARGVLLAVERDNPDATVSHLPGLVRIQAPGRLVIRRVSVEEQLGRAWETHEFQLAIVSYFGHIAEWDEDEIVIQWDH